MGDIIAVISQDEGMVVTTQEYVVNTNTNLANPVALESLDMVADVDVTTNGKLNGSVLVYKTTTNRWTSTTTLDAQNMEGGEF